MEPRQMPIVTTYQHASHFHVFLTYKSNGVMPMNLVQTVPELQKASLNGVHGLGYAESIPGANQSSEIRGVVVFDADIDLASVSRDEQKETLFQGAVYRDGLETIETLPVEIVLIHSDDNMEPGVTFVGKTS